MSLHFSFFIGKNSTGASETKHWQDMITKPRQAVVQWHRLKPEWWNAADVYPAKWRRSWWRRKKERMKKRKETTKKEHQHTQIMTLISCTLLLLYIYFSFFLLQRPHKKSLTIYFVDRNGFVHDTILKWPTKKKTNIERERWWDNFFVLMIWSRGFVYMNLSFLIGNCFHSRNWNGRKLTTFLCFVWSSYFFFHLEVELVEKISLSLIPTKNTQEKNRWSDLTKEERKLLIWLNVSICRQKKT